MYFKFIHVITFTCIIRFHDRQVVDNRIVKFYCCSFVGSLLPQSAFCMQFEKHIIPSFSIKYKNEIKTLNVHLNKELTNQNII